MDSPNDNSLKETLQMTLEWDSLAYFLRRESRAQKFTFLWFWKSTSTTYFGFNFGPFWAPEKIGLDNKRDVAYDCYNQNIKI